MKPATRAVHGAGSPPLEGCEPVSVPIYASSTFHHASLARLDEVAGGASGYMYARYRNPTGVALEHALAALEEADCALVFGSGMAALHAAILAGGVTPGDVIVCARDVYGGTVGLLQNVFQPLGINLRYPDFFNADELDAALSGEGVRLVIAETISNPLLRVLDLETVAEKAHAAGARLLVDSTFTTPLLARPLALGADYCVHSATKYFGGHGDVTGGVVLASAAERPALEACRKLVGGILSPFEAWLILRGLQTLPLRLERQCANAAGIARWLRAHPAVERVHYPGFEDHPDRATIARRLPAGLAGGVVSCELRLPAAALASTDATKAAVIAILDRLELIQAGTSLGDVQSLVMYPLIASHRDLDPEQRRRVGIRDNLVRFSLGIEDAGDLIEDLERALGPAPEKGRS